MPFLLIALATACGYLVGDRAAVLGFVLSTAFVLIVNLID